MIKRGNTNKFNMIDYLFVFESIYDHLLCEKEYNKWPCEEEHIESMSRKIPYGNYSNALEVGRHQYTTGILYSQSVRNRNTEQTGTD